MIENFIKTTMNREKITVSLSILVVFAVLLSVIGASGIVAAQQTSVYYGEDVIVTDDSLSEGDEVLFESPEFGDLATATVQADDPDGGTVAIDSAELRPEDEDGNPTTPEQDGVEAWLLDENGDKDTLITDDIHLQEHIIEEVNVSPNVVQFDQDEDSVVIEIESNEPDDWSPLIDVDGIDNGEFADASDDLQQYTSGGETFAIAPNTGDTTVTVDMTDWRNEAPEQYDFTVESVEFLSNGSSGQIATDTGPSGNAAFVLELEDEDETVDMDITLQNQDAPELEYTATGNHGDTVEIDAEEGDYDWEVDADGYVPETGTLSILGGETTTQQVELQELSSENDLTITADSDEESFEGDFEATVFDEEDNVVEDGTFSDEIVFTLTNGEYTVRVSADNHISEERDVEIELGQDTSEQFTLTYIDTDGTEVLEGNTYWLGQLLVIADEEEIDPEETITFTHEDGEIAELIASEDGAFIEFEASEVADTAAGTGEYTVTDEQGTVLRTFTIDEQSLTFSADDSEVSILDIEGEDTDTVFTIESNRSSTFTVELTEIFDEPTDPDDGEREEALTDEELSDIFDVPVSEIEDGVFEVTVTNGEEQIEADFEGLHPDTTYEFEVTEPVTEASDSASVETYEPFFIEDPEDVDADEIVQSGGNYWLGQILVTPVEFDGTVDLHIDETFESELEPLEDGTVLIFSELYSAGEYEVEGFAPDGTEQSVLFNVREQQFTVERDFDAEDNDDDEDSRVIRDEGANTSIVLDYSSNRATYDVVVEQIHGDGEDEGDELTANDLADRIDGATVQQDDDGEDIVVIENVMSFDNPEFEFDGIEPGDYEFEFHVRDTVASDSLDITVEAFEEGEISFAEMFFDSARGDTAEIDVEFTSGADTAQLKIGDEDEFGYEIIADLERENPGSSNVYTIEFDTSIAGLATADSADVLSPHEDDEEDITVTVQEETTIPDGFRLVQSRYLLEIRDSDDQLADLATLRHQQVGVNDASFQPIPFNVPNQDVFEVPEEVVQDGIPEGDVLTDGGPGFLVFEVAGLQSVLQDETLTAGDFAEGASLESEGIQLTIEHENPGTNQSPQDLDVSQLSYAYDSENNRVIFTIDSNDMPNIQEDGEYTAVLTLDEEESEFIDEDAELEQEVGFTHEEVFVDFDKYEYGDDGEEYVLLDDGNEEQVLGETNIPDGSEIEIRAFSESTFTPFVQSETVTIEDGQFEAFFDTEGLIETQDQESEFPIWDSEEVSTYDDAVDIILHAHGYGDKQGLVLHGADIIKQGEDPDASSLEVVVQDEDSEPMEDITVNLSDEESQMTDEDGIVLYEFLDDGDYTITVEEEGYESVSDTITIDGFDVSRTITLIEEEEEEEEVEDEEVADVQIIFTNEDGERLNGELDVNGETYTIEDGERVIQLDYDEYTLIGTAEGYDDPVEQSGNVSESSLRIEFEFSDGEEEEPETDDTEPVQPDDGEDEDERAPGQPGFGAVIALLAVLGTALVIARRQN